jgi:hypothetical protein
MPGMPECREWRRTRYAVRGANAPTIRTGESSPFYVGTGTGSSGCGNSRNNLATSTAPPSPSKPSPKSTLVRDSYAEASRPVVWQHRSSRRVRTVPCSSPARRVGTCVPSTSRGAVKWSRAVKRSLVFRWPTMLTVARLSGSVGTTAFTEMVKRSLGRLGRYINVNMDFYNPVAPELPP